MRSWEKNRLLSGFVSAMLLAGVTVGGGESAALAGVSTGDPDPVRLDEYPIYDLVIRSKFLTSDTTLVVIDRLTVTRVTPEEESDNRRFFEENQLFEGALPPTLVQDFLLKLLRPSRLEAKFQLGVRYRLIFEHDSEGSEVSLAPIPAAFSEGSASCGPRAGLGQFRVGGCNGASGGRVNTRPIQYDASIIKLALSRVAFSPRADRALVYVGNDRADGSGAGFLVFLGRGDRDWEILDTEVVWTARVEPRR